jgi:hypothetical protein
MFFDGSDVGLADTSDEDVVGAWFDSNNFANPDSSDIYLSTRGAFSVPGEIGDGADIFKCTPSSIGTTTACSYAFTWDGGGNGIKLGVALDGIDLEYPTAPSVSITAPANNAQFAQGTPVTFSGTATDTQDGSKTASISWTSSLNGAIGSGGSFTTSALTAGTHTITASVTDSGGLVGSAARTVTITAAVNTAPIVSTSAPANNSTLVYGQSANFIGTANDTEQGSLTSSLIWTSNRDGQIGKGGNFSKSNLSMGTHTITAEVTDSGGLKDSKSIIVKVHKK